MWSNDKKSLCETWLSQIDDKNLYIFSRSKYLSWPGRSRDLSLSSECYLMCTVFTMGQPPVEDGPYQRSLAFNPLTERTGPWALIRRHWSKTRSWYTAELTPTSPQRMWPISPLSGTVFIPSGYSGEPSLPNLSAQAVTPTGRNIKLAVLGRGMGDMLERIWWTTTN